MQLKCLINYQRDITGDIEITSTPIVLLIQPTEGTYKLVETSSDGPIQEAGGQ